jgi:spore maturation protein CgeB
MKFVVFGLTISSSWGNGHATLWRGLMRALTSLGHSVTFFEREVPYYATNRDLWDLWQGAELVLYDDWRNVAAKAIREIQQADAAIVTSYCPDGREASKLVLENAPALRLFYDLDTPVTLSKLKAGEQVPYLPEQGLSDFDLVLSYTGGGALDELRDRLGARRTAPLYGHVDHYWHKPAPKEPWYSADLSYLGTYAADRQQALERLLIEPARRRSSAEFLVGGSAYPIEIEWPDNVRKLDHIPPSHHPSFFSSSRLTLNITRADMAKMGWCPSGRLFEAAACGAAMVSDNWDGLEEFFEPGEEILLAGEAEEVVAALRLPDSELKAIGNRARERVLDEHTSAHRARELVELIDDCSRKREPARQMQEVEACGA